MSIRAAATPPPPPPTAPEPQEQERAIHPLRGGLELKCLTLEGGALRIAYQLVGPLPARVASQGDCTVLLRNLSGAQDRTLAEATATYQAAVERWLRGYLAGAAAVTE